MQTEIKEDFRRIRKGYFIHEALITGGVIIFLWFSDSLNDTIRVAIGVVAILIMLAVNIIGSLLIDIREENYIANEDILHELNNIAKSSLDTSLSQKKH